MRTHTWPTDHESGAPGVLGCGSCGGVVDLMGDQHPPRFCRCCAVGPRARHEKTEDGRCRNRAPNEALVTTARRSSR